MLQSAHELTSIRGLLGYLLSLSPLACDLMGWRGAGGDGAASMSVFPFFLASDSC